MSTTECLVIGLVGGVIGALLTIVVVSRVDIPLVLPPLRETTPTPPRAP